VSSLAWNFLRSHQARPSD